MANVHIATASHCIRRNAGDLPKLIVSSHRLLLWLEVNTQEGRKANSLSKQPFCVMVRRPARNKLSAIPHAEAVDLKGGQAIPLNDLIDCDIHPAVPSLAALKPYMDDHW